MTAWRDAAAADELRRNPSVLLPIAAAAIAAAALLLRMLNSGNTSSNRRRKEEGRVPDREELKRRVAAAAESRNNNDNLAERDGKPRRRKKKGGNPPPPSSLPSRRRRKREEHGNRNNDDDDDDGEDTGDFPPEVISQEASLGERVAWEEEKSSREQFNGFNIYGGGGLSDMGGNLCVECSPESLATASADLLHTVGFGGSLFGGIHRVTETRGLPGSDQALGLLNRLRREFEPVVQSRGWTVLLLREFGADDERRPPNIAGYCVSAGNARTAVRICLRLRRPSVPAEFRPYRDLVRTMAHELAHIVHIRHNEAFFALMDEILRERDEKSTNAAGSPVFPLTSGRRLGTDQGSPSPILGSRELKQRTARAAMQRTRSQKKGNTKKEKKRL